MDLRAVGYLPNMKEDGGSGFPSMRVQSEDRATQIAKIARAT